MATLETILSDARRLSLVERQRLVRELARANLIDLMRQIETNPVDPLPVSDEELNQIVHEARRKVLRARGL